MGTINFIHPAFRPKVVCDKPSTDGYDVSNLISVQNYMPPKAFMVESFMGPPVSIYFTFPCNIEIDRIILHGTVGAQKSTGYELFCFSALRKSDTCIQRWDPSPGSPAPTVASFASYKFTPLGRLWQEQQTQYADVVCFSNPSFHARSPFSVLSPMPSKLFEQLTVDVEMRRQNAQNLMSVSHLLVRITRTAEGRLPALRWIEVWGQPSVTSIKEDMERVLSAYDSVMRPTPAPPAHSTLTPAPPAHTPTTQLRHHMAPPRPHEDTDTTVEAPAEFCDPITCNIMTQPMLLPCGKSIDLSTLEKFNDDQAKLNRAPSDPFTFVLYTPSVKPVPNAKLKMRIDHYLMTNTALNAPRTLGRSVDLRTANRKAGENGTQTSVLLQERPKQDRPVAPTPAQKPLIHSLPGVRPTRTLHQQQQQQHNQQQRQQQHSSLIPVPAIPSHRPIGYPKSISSQTQPSAPSSIPSDPLASLDRSLELVLAGRPSYHSPAPIMSPLILPTSPHLPLSPNGASTSSQTQPNDSLRRIAPKRPLLDPGPNLTMPLTKTARSHSLTNRGMNLTTPGPKTTRTHSMGASPTSPVIDLTTDSDSDEVIPVSKSSQVSVSHSSVIRRNPAALRERSQTQSLDKDIDKTLSGLPSFHNAAPQTSTSSALLSAPTQPKLECVFCTLYREVGVMYKLGCNDVACRDCLSTRRKTGQLVCYKCDRTTSTRDIVKLHM